MAFFSKSLELVRELIRSIDRLTDRVDALQARTLDLEKTILKSSAEQSPTTPTNKKVPAGLAIAVMGARGHGQKHIDNFLKLKGCYISYVCDVDTRVGKIAVEKIAKAQGYKPKLVQDVRVALADKVVDILSISAPHHWHALATIWALKAGKHVYIEKPITHTYAEGPSVLAAAKKYGKIVQSGTQLRSNTSLQAAGEYMRSGKLGDIEVVHCVVYKERPNLPQKTDLKVPATVDYDLWCGPATKSDLNRSKFHYHWHWFWEYGNGALGNNGIHRIDAARIALDLKGYGDLVVSYGGRFGPKDTGETPNMQVTLHKFGKTWIVQDIIGLKNERFRGIENGILFYGSKGTIIYTSGKARLYDKDDKEVRVFEGKQLNHYYNFLEAVRRNDQDFARGDLIEGLISSELCHLGNASYRAGQLASDDEIESIIQKIGAPDFVQSRLKNMRKNLTDNGVNEKLILGDVLKLRDTRAPIIDNPDAAKFLESHHRAPYTLE